MKIPPFPRHLPQAPGRCAFCGTAIIEERDASVTKLHGKWAILCRNHKECLARRHAARDAELGVGVGTEHGETLP